MSEKNTSAGIGYLVLLVAILVVGYSFFTDVSFAGAGWEGNGERPVETVEPLDPPWPADAIVALNNAECGGNNGASFGGSGETHIYAGGIFSNYCLAGNGSIFEVIVENGYVRYVGDFWGYNGFTPDPEHVFVPITETVDLVEVIQAECEKLPDYRADLTSQQVEQTTLYPGNYATLAFSSGGWILVPGLYCVSGNVSFLSGANVEARDVTLFVNGGDVSIDGDSNLVLSAPRREIGPLNIFRHLLFYVTTGNVTWVGGSSQHAYGRVYAPKGSILVSGSSELGELNLLVQFVGWDMEVTGSYVIEIMPYFLDSFPLAPSRNLP